MQRAHRRWHLRIWIALALLLPVVFGAAIWLRLRQSLADAPVRIDAPARDGIKGGTDR